MPPHFPGEILALLSALFWALAVILFKKSGETVHPLGLNLFKNLLALVLIIPTLRLVGEPLLPSLPASYYLRFVLSGILGMTIGDTLFFVSLNRIGAGLAAVVSYMYGPLLVILSLIFLHEQIGLPQVLGSLLILTALLISTDFRNPPSRNRRHLPSGIILGLLSTAATAAGVIIIKPLLDQTPLLWATALRLLVGLVGLLIFIPLMPDRLQIISSAFNRSRLGYSIAGTILGTYIALTLWLGGMKYTRVSTAAPLNQLSNIFVFIFGALLLREPVNGRRLAAILLAFTGAVLVILK